MQPVADRQLGPAIAYAILAVYTVPLLTIGVYRLARGERSSASETSAF